MKAKVTLTLARHLVRLYPSRWRAYYAEEALDLLVARPPTWGDVGNLLFHAFFTHLFPPLSLAGEASPRERLVILMRTLRSSEIVVFCAFVGAVVAWLQFGGLIDGGPYAPLVTTGSAWPLVGFRPENGLSAALAVQSGAIDLAFLAVLAGGLPLAIAAWRRAPHLRRYFLVPVAGFVGAILPALIAIPFAGHQAVINLGFETLITNAYLVWFVGLATLSTWALSRVISASDLDDWLVQFAFWPSILTTGALLLLVGATVAWGLAAHQQVPHLFDQSDLTVGHVTVATWTIDVVAMAVAALVALLATLRGAATRTANPAA
jgi:hypothetical protein